MIITLPPPDARLHAHNNGHWRSKAGAVKTLRDYACVIGKAMRTKTLTKARIRYRFFVADNRRRDIGNLIHSQKPAIDGLVDAKLLTDDCWQVVGKVEAEVMIDRDRPRVELVIEEVV